MRVAHVGGVEEHSTGRPHHVEYLQVKGPDGRLFSRLGLARLG